MGKLKLPLPPYFLGGVGPYLTQFAAATWVCVHNPPRLPEPLNVAIVPRCMERALPLSLLSLYADITSYTEFQIRWVIPYNTVQSA